MGPSDVTLNLVLCNQKTRDHYTNKKCKKVHCQVNSMFIGHVLSFAWKYYGDTRFCLFDCLFVFTKYHGTNMVFQNVIFLELH